MAFGKDFGSRDQLITGDRLITPDAANRVLEFGKNGDAGSKVMDLKIYGSSSSVYRHFDGSADTVYDVGITSVEGGTASVTISDGDGATNLIPRKQFLGTTKAGASILVGAWNTTNDATVAPSINILKSGNATIGSSTIVASGEVLGEVTFFGDDGADYEAPAAQIQALVDTTPGAGDMPGRLVFKTTADSGETLTEALRITSAQDVRVNDGGGLIVGSTSAQITISDGDGATNLIPEVQVLGTTKADGSLLLMVNSATATSAAAPSVNLVKSAHATLGSNTGVASGEVLGEVNFFGADGTDFESCAVSIRGLANAATGTGDMPGRLSIFTSTDGAETPTERVRVTGTATASTLALGIAGATTGTLTFAGTTSGVVTIQALAAAGTYTLSLPPDDGDAGEQLQTDGNGVMTWESAASYRDAKELHGLLEPETALQRIVDAPVHRFTYKKDYRGVGRDYETEFAGIVADEAPWAMKHKGRIFNEISAFGHAAAAIKALYERLTAAEAKLALVGG